MYDRKTWIVIAVCSVLLAVNLYYNQQNAKARLEQQQRELAQNPPPEKSPDSENSAADIPDPEPPPGVLLEVDPAEVIETRTVLLETPETIFTLTSLGGGVKQAELKNQAAVGDNSLHVILNEGATSAVGALADGADGLERVNYEYREEESEPGQRVVFLGKHPSGLVVKKTWSLVASDQVGSGYLLDLQVDVENSESSATQLPLDRFSLYLGRAQPLTEKELTPSGFFWREDGSFTFEKATVFKGGIFSKAQSLMMITATEMEYAGVSNQLFATMLRSEDVGTGGIWSKGYSVKLEEGGKELPGVRAGYNLPLVTLVPGQRESFRYQLFMGPKENQMLRKMNHGMGDIMNYGWFSIFSRMMNFLLVKAHHLVSMISDKWSWGFAIIFVTLFVRSLMWPLYARSNRTMKRMAKLKPEMARLKEKYPDDPTKVQQETMGLYRKFGINPLGGCLPMMAQIPIFFGFYRMLQYAVELRGNGFLWVTDLSQPDTVAEVMGYPLNILPILMGLSSFVQMSMMPNTSGDKTQQMVMKMMPLMFFFFCYNFAAALALYWTTSNLFSIFQTWLTKRMPEPELTAKPGSQKKSFMQRMTAAAEQQQKMKKARGRVVEEEAPSKKKRGPRTGG